MKNIAVLGSTGSIGTQALEVLRASKGAFRAAVLCAKSHAELLLAQAEEFRPELVCVEDEGAARMLEGRLPPGVGLYCGADAGSVAASFEGADVVVHGIGGFAGTLPLIAALRAGKRVGLANKESVVCAMPLVERAKKEGGGEIVPVDSEQSALFQCLAAGRREDVKRLILTASGGPFRAYGAEELARVTPKEALRHPTWKMGKKVTLDSATLFNKGLEIIEAAHLFGFGADMIEVTIHPQSVVHSMVEYRDCSVIAQLAAPDMRLAIRYALTYPERTESDFGALDLTRLAGLTFEKPDGALFPALGLAYAALRAGGLASCAYSAANEAAGELFLAGRIGFLDIPALVSCALERAPAGEADSLEAILEADGRARALVIEKAR
ncbi:MAG TPA: 1-deoxy-D-xylulose-5-phosphate reductoisomerase [Clostridia bacterium]|nr:1-deoxy-D-xylulose-5-phosphate reductoisomerase [Clostridia bacterium]